MINKDIVTRLDFILGMIEDGGDAHGAIKGMIEDLQQPGEPDQKDIARTLQQLSDAVSDMQEVIETRGVRPCVMELNRMTNLPNWGKLHRLLRKLAGC